MTYAFGKFMLNSDNKACFLKKNFAICIGTFVYPVKIVCTLYFLFSIVNMSVFEHVNGVMVHLKMECMRIRESIIICCLLPKRVIIFSLKQCIDTVMQGRSSYSNTDTG